MRPAAFLQRTAQDSLSWDMAAFLARPGPATLAFLNAHAVTTAHRNPDFARALWEADLILRDGIGVKLGLLAFGYGKTENLNGTDLITKLLGGLQGRSLAIFGASEEVMEATATRLRRDALADPRWLDHGFHADEHYLTRVQQVSPDVILLCMGMPRQEILAAKLRESGYQGLIICGGGWADFYSGNKARAPRWMRKIGLEWLFRFAREPRRLGKRYTVDILLFFAVVLRDRLKQRSGDTP